MTGLGAGGGGGGGRPGHQGDLPVQLRHQAVALRGRQERAGRDDSPLGGAPDIGALARAWQALVARHEALRTVFAAQDSSRMHGAVLGPEAFLLRFFGADGDDRLLLVNFGIDLRLDPPAPHQMHGADVLGPAMAAGTQIGSFHPLVAFADLERALADLHGATVALEQGRVVELGEPESRLAAGGRSAPADRRPSSAILLPARRSTVHRRTSRRPRGRSAG